MLWIYGTVVLLVACLVIPNALYGFRKFLEDRNRLVFTVYFGLLVLLCSLVLHTTARTAEFVQAAKEIYTDPGP